MDGDTGTPDTTTQTPPQPSLTKGTLGEQTDQAFPAQQSSSSPVSIVTQPNVVRPAKRGGLAGVMDDIADSIAGTQGSARIYKDSDGNEYIQHPTLSRGQQWLKIAGEAIRGAAAGAAAKPGPGQLGRAAEAGVNAGDTMVDRQRQQDEATRQQARQENQDRFNQIKLKHDVAAKEFELQRLKVVATQEDQKFAQEQSDRMMRLVDEGKAFDLGTYRDEADLARVKQVNPNFWKDVYQNNITAVPQIGADGKRSGIRLFQTTPGIGNELVEPGTPFKVFNPPAKPGDEPRMEDHIPTVPMTWNQKHAYDLAAYTQMQKWRVDQANIDKKEGTDLDARKTQAQIDRDEAEAAAARARAKKDLESGGGMGYLERPDGSVWIGDKSAADANGFPFEPMKPGDVNKDKIAMRQLNTVQLDASRYTRAATSYANPQANLTYRGKPVSPDNPVHPESALNLIGMGKTITSAGELREQDNTNLNTLMNKAGYANFDASLSGAGGHINIPMLSAFGESLSRQVNTKAYNDLSDQAKDLYDGYLRTMAAMTLYVQAVSKISRQNKETLNLELANIKHPGYAPADIVRGQNIFQQNIDQAATGYPRNMVGVPHPADVRRQIENNGGNPNLPEDVQRLLNMSNFGH